MSQTISVIKADIGSNAGHLKPSDGVVDAVKDHISDQGEPLDDHIIHTVGDDINIIMSHTMGKDADEIHGLAWDAFMAGTDVAKSEGLYGAGQDLLDDAFSGNVRGLGPGIAEIEFSERTSEPLMIFGADKTEPGAFNQPLYTCFADPKVTPGLLLKDEIHEGFTFEILDLEGTAEERVIELSVPEDTWKLVALLMEPHRFGVKCINSRHDGQTVASVSTQKLRNVAGEYVGKDDPVAIVRTQGNFPSPGEVLQPYAQTPLVAGAMRGSHHGHLYPIADDPSEIPSYFDGPPLVKAIGLIVNDGEFSDPIYPFDSSFWDSIRQDAAKKFRSFREQQGSFGPGSVEASELEYGGWSDIIDGLESRWES